MSVTIDKSPSGIPAAYRPVIFEVESDRYDSTLLAVASVSSGTGGYARFSTSTSGVFQVGDILIGSGFTSTAVAYNVRQTVTATTGTWYETDVLYVASGTGTLTRSNDNFQMKCETFVFDSAKVLITSVTNYFGTAILNYASASLYQPGDIIFVEGTTNYNGIVKVISVATTAVLVNIAYVSNQTGKSRSGRIVGTKRQDAIVDSVGDIIFRLNCSGHLQAVLSPDLADGTPANIQTPASNSCKLFAIRFTEEYDDVDGILQTHDTIFSTAFYSARAVWQHNAIDASLIDYYTPGVNCKFLTNAPKTKLIRVGEEEQLSFLSDGALNCRATIQKYDLGGAALTLVNLASVDIIDDKGIIPINSNIFNSSISKFEVWITTGTTQLTEKRTFIVDKNNYQNPIRVHFENPLGGSDAYTFTGDFSIGSKTIRSSFQKTLPLGFVRRDRGTTDIGNNTVIAKEKYSSLLNIADATWLNDLMNSVDVYTKNVGETVFTPINVLSDTQVIYDSVVPPQMKFTYSESNGPLGLAN